MHRPDNRDPAIVWKYFLEAFRIDFPSVGWAIGSDWGMGSPYGMSAADYRNRATQRMIAIYGENPNEEK